VDQANLSAGRAYDSSRRRLGRPASLNLDGRPAGRICFRHARIRATVAPAQVCGAREASQITENLAFRGQRPHWCFSGSVLADEKKPNIIFIMADDLGNADLGYRGGKVITQISTSSRRAGFRLESFYGQQVWHAGPRGSDDRALSHALRPANPGDLSKPHYVCRRTSARAASAQRRRLQDLDAEMASWPCGQEVSGRKTWLRYFYGKVMGEVEYCTATWRVIDWQRNAHS